MGGDAPGEGALEAPSLLHHERRIRSCELGKRSGVARIGAEDADVFDLGPAGVQSVEEERPVEVGSLPG
jgi:hypothetical protein